MMANKSHTWEDKQVKWYRKKQNYHAKLWEWVEQTITALDIRSVLEIGGGPGLLSSLVDHYTGVDLSRSAIKCGQAMFPRSTFIHGDWLDIDLGPLIGEFDMVLALAVIEHTIDHDRFLSRILEVRPRVAIVSYFQNLIDGKSYTVYREDPMGCQFVQVRHELSRIKEFLDGKGLRGMYHVRHERFGRKVNLVDGILTITPTQEWRNA